MATVFPLEYLLVPLKHFCSIWSTLIVKIFRSLCNVFCSLCNIFCHIWSPLIANSFCSLRNIFCSFQNYSTPRRRRKTTTKVLLEPLSVTRGQKKGLTIESYKIPKLLPYFQVLLSFFWSSSTWSIWFHISYVLCFGV